MHQEPGTPACGTARLCCLRWHATNQAAPPSMQLYSCYFTPRCCGWLDRTCVLVSGGWRTAALPVSLAASTHSYAGSITTSQKFSPEPQGMPQGHDASSL